MKLLDITESILEKAKSIFYNYPKRCIYVAKMILQERNRNRNHKISEIYGKRIPKIYVLANGPSLNCALEEKLDELKNNPVMCLNYFAETDWFSLIKPQYYVLRDPNIFFNEKEIPDGFRKSVDRMIDAINKADWHILILVPESARDSYFQKKIDNIDSKYIEVYYYSCYQWPGLFFSNRLLFRYLEKDLIAPPGATVANTAICLAISMKAKQIILYGCDFSLHEDIFVESKTNKLMIKDKHFDVLEPNARYLYSDTKATKHMKVSEFFKIMTSWHEECDFLQAYANNRGSVIYNCSNSSYIDAFKRK